MHASEHGPLIVMSMYSYVGTPNSNLICCICHSPFMRPATTAICTHTFCYDCLLVALSHSPCCPIDRKPLPSGAEIVEVGGVVKAMVDELLVECPHRAEGCEETMERQMAHVHLREECEFGERRRKRSGDGQNQKVKEASDQVSQAQRCPHSVYGCSFTSPSSSDAPAHLDTCAYEALKDFISSNNAKVALLTEQNVMLRRRLDTTESNLTILKRDVTVLKSVVGPWYRSPSSATPVSNSSPSLPTTGISSAVPPLETSGTIEGTLLGMREGMLGLAGAIEGVGKRSEIGLANETLRLGEEMMCIRGQIHGLRMQLHGMLMERYTNSGNGNNNGTHGMGMGFGGFGAGTTKL